MCLRRDSGAKGRGSVEGARREQVSQGGRRKSTQSSVMQ